MVHFAGTGRRILSPSFRKLPSVAGNIILKSEHQKTNLLIFAAMFNPTIWNARSIFFVECSSLNINGNQNVNTG
jgi:hypothetical protein